ncbi:phosphatidylserine decarboxylase [Acidisphaera rubrifaciens]|uniref:Phosphatidylserine decarboxylase proenzyme n=1 Tax=Acidisphaera rubrifaciens HS-AP3 TaxID=1231350 RepID=A0A0D6P5I3_9PROT|nr:phosphatidylserine decarboxylase [Acidisphaera rubrifaciens]GAN76119.1 phosphatidylserine decarboxylase [Acidisphaera rubrifaciens HS-AP3]
MGLAESLRVAFPGPHPAGRPFLFAAAVVLVVGLFVSHVLAVLGLAALLFCLFFFRDPARVAPPRAGAVVAPADGRVVTVGPAVPPAELGLGDAPLPRVGIFLSVLDVHVNRIPADGVVTRIAYRHGRFVNASLDKASDENERNALAIRLPDGRMLAVVQIAGLIARRILCDVHEGEAVRTGARFGIIRFGSRTDLYLPAGTMPLVVPGQRMVGGETVIAELT